MGFITSIIVANARLLKLDIKIIAPTRENIHTVQKAGQICVGAWEEFRDAIFYFKNLKVPKVPRQLVPHRY